MILKRALLFNINALIIISAFILNPCPTFADIAGMTIETGCTDVASYNGELQPATGTYDLYVRLGRAGDQAQVQGYTQILGQQGVCVPYAAVAATGNGWTKFGTFTADGTDTYIFQLSSPSLAALPTANRPTVMLVPHANPVCVPTTECTVNIRGQTGYVQPPGTLLNQDSLHVLQVANPAKDTIKQVDYYAGDTLAYTLPTLRPFDLRYLSSDKETATAVIQYASGQQVVVPQPVPETYVYENPFNILFRVYHKAPLLPRLLVAATVLLMLAWLGLWSLDRWHRHRLWEDNHGFTAYEQAHFTPLQRRFVQMRSRFLRIAGPATLYVVLTIAVLSGIVATSSYALTLYQIDGHSMEATYDDKHWVFVNKLPVTWARMNGRQYIPKRGDVVIVRAVFGNATTALASTVDLSLIKRVIGLPGDHVVIAGGNVTIYDKAHPGGFNPDMGAAWEKTMHHNLSTEQLDIQLSQDEIFVSGDNRPESIDSRLGGPIQTKEIIGVVSGKVW